MSEANLSKEEIAELKKIVRAVQLEPCKSPLDELMYDALCLLVRAAIRQADPKPGEILETAP